MRDGARSLMAILAVIYLAEIGFSNSQVGIIFGFSLAGGFVISVVVMLTSRGVSTRTWAVVNMLITAGAGVLLIVSNDFWILIIGGFFGSYAASGAHWGGMMQLEQTGIAAVVPQERRTRAYSNLTIASSAGRATGALLAGLSTLLINTFEWEPISAYHAILWPYVGMHGIAALVYLILSKAVNLQSTRKRPHFFLFRQPPQGPCAPPDSHHLQPFRYRFLRWRHGFRIVRQLLALHQIRYVRRGDWRSAYRCTCVEYSLTRLGTVGR